MGYGYYAVETVQSSQVTGTLTDFPALFSRTSAGAGSAPDFRTVGNGGKVTDAQGDDLVLFTDTTLVTKMDQETELYVAATGQVIKHARVSSIATGTTRVWAFGNTAVTTTQDNAAGVWDANYTNIYHQGDGSNASSLLPGSTTTPYNLSDASNSGSVSATTGKVYGGGHYVRASSSSGAYLKNANAPVSSFPWTFECWAKLTDTSFGASSQRIILSVSKSTGSNWTGINYQANSSTVYVGMINQQTGTTYTTLWTIPGGADTNWHHIAGVFTSASSLQAYYDGAAMTLFSDFGGTPQTPTGMDTINIGAELESGPFVWSPFHGDLDESRVSSNARAGAWITASYNTQNAPTSFWGLGNQVTILAPPFMNRTVQVTKRRRYV